MMEADPPRFTLDSGWSDDLASFIRSGGLYSLPSSDIYRRLHSDLSRLLGKKYVLTYPNGTAAISASIKALNIQSGQQVAVPVYAYPAACHACLYNGVVPIPVDIETISLNIDPADLEKVILSFPIKAIVTVNMWGIPARFREISDLARRFGVPIIEDASRSISASRDGILSIRDFGDVSCVSLNIHKVLGVGEGGALLTNDPDVYDRAALSTQVIHTQVACGRNKRYVGAFFGCKGKMSPLMAFLATKACDVANKRIKDCASNHKYAVRHLRNIIALLTPVHDSHISRGAWSGMAFNFSNPKDRDGALKSFAASLRRAKIPIKEDYPSNFAWQNTSLFGLSSLFPAIQQFQKNMEKYPARERWPQAFALSERLMIAEDICSYHGECRSLIDSLADKLRAFGDL